MSSMTDIVFLMLIFFIVLSTLVVDNPFRVDVPESSVKNQGKQTIAVTISPDISWYVGSKEVTEEGLESALLDALRGQEEPGIILHADRTVPIKHVMTVMQIASRNKFSLRLATKTS